ncbi:nicotinic acid mononucleotide adenyltransferase [Flavobacteriaceae bacterium R38]|nr:nicotinic acid mononucleotide adenyltransferase [Flavobacteriaceae bacterium R38]
MKNLIMTFAMLFSVVLMAQTDKPLMEKEGDLTKVTYFHENGKVAQIGFYKNKKIHGQWKAYDVKGKKIAVANYDEGKKVGKWLFWNENGLKEVDYSDNRIVSVTNWNNSNRVVINEK